MGLEVNVDKTKYKVKFREQSARVNQNKKTDNISFERVELFRYLGTTLTIKFLFKKKLKLD
jgi:hypothetical protein